jgi:hypothetical protein
MLAIPTTTVQKMIGPITILTSLMNPSPSGFMLVPTPGQKWPIATPRAIAINTWM